MRQRRWQDNLGELALAYAESCRLRDPEAPSVTAHAELSPVADWWAAKARNSTNSYVTACAARTTVLLARVAEGLSCGELAGGPELVTTMCLDCPDPRARPALINRLVVATRGRPFQGAHWDTMQAVGGVPAEVLEVAVGLADGFSGGLDELVTAGHLLSA